MLREAQQICVAHIERNQADEMLAYLKKNSDLVVNEIVDTNGKTLLHECTFNNSVKCLKLLL